MNNFWLNKKKAEEQVANRGIQLKTSFGHHIAMVDYSSTIAPQTTSSCVYNTTVAMTGTDGPYATIGLHDFTWNYPPIIIDSTNIQKEIKINWTPPPAPTCTVTVTCS